MGRGLFIKIVMVSLWVLFCVHVSTVYAQAMQGDDVADEFDDFEDEFEDMMDEDTEKKVFDPLIGYNRFMYRVNDKIYLVVIAPPAHIYAKVVPKPVRASVDRAFRNVAFPIRFLNMLFQFKFKRAGIDMGRFLINSTFGVGGLFDPADRYMGWHRGDEDFGQTLGFYGMGGGLPIVLPLLGPSNLRDTLAMVPDALVDPLAYVSPTEASVGLYAGKTLNYTSLHLSDYENLKKDALDPYTFFRDVYEQNRDNKIKE